MQHIQATCKRCGGVKEEDICGGSLNTIWAGGALRDTEVEVICGSAGGWSSTTRSPWRRRGSSSYSISPGWRPPASGQRESFFQSRDENESFSDSISFIETRPRIPDTYSQASRRDREKISSNLGHRDEIEIYYLHSQASRREREFP